MKKLTLLFIIFIIFCGKSPVEDEPVKIYKMTVVEVLYYDLYCYNFIDGVYIIDAHIDLGGSSTIINFTNLFELDKKFKTNIGRATGNIQVFENSIGWGGYYYYPENYPLNKNSKAISGIDSLSSNINIINDNVRIKIYENDKSLYEFMQENSKGKTFFRTAYITKIYICGILMN